MIAFHARRPLRFGLLAGALALSAVPGAARAELEFVEFTYQKVERSRAMTTSPAPSAAPVAPSGWDPVKKEKITGKPKTGAQAQTELEFLRQRAAPLGNDNASNWIRVGQPAASGPRKADVISKRITGEARRPDRGQVAMETLVIQHEGMKAPKAPQGAALDDLPSSPPAPGAIAPAPRARSRAFNPTELSVTKTVPWKQQRRSRAAATSKAIAAK